MRAYNVSTSFWGKADSKDIWERIPVKKSFYWGGKEWSIPVVYTGSNKLLVDFCIRIPCREVETYFKEWEEGKEGRNPFTNDFYTKAVVNGTEAENRGGCCSTMWHPCDSFREGIGAVEEGLMEVYGCCREDGWTFVRTEFLWKEDKKEELKSLVLFLEAEPVSYPGGTIITEEGCGVFELDIRHPVSETGHHIKILSCEPRLIPEEAGIMEGYRLPRNCHVLSYTVTPELSQEEFTIQDSVESDQPEEAGPTSFFYMGRARKEPGVHTAVSSFHYIPVREVIWRYTFYIKEKDNIRIELIP